MVHVFVPQPSPGVSVVRRSPAKVLAALVRNPLLALPREVYREPLVIERVNGRDRVYISDPALIREAMVTHADCLIKGDEVRRALSPALGDGLLTADGAHWRWQRTAVAPAFQHQSLLGFLPAMIAAAEATRDRWLATPIVRLGHEMMRTTFDIIVETMLSGPDGIDVDRVEQGVTDYLAPSRWIFALDILRAPEWTPYPGRRRGLAAATYLRAAVTAMVAHRRREEVARDDLVSLLLAAADPATGRTMSDTEVTDNVLTFITAGHETTAVGLAWTLYLLTRHPVIEEAMLAEIRAVTGGRRLTPEHVVHLAYTRQVFSEAMRVYPPSPVLTRKVIRTFDLGAHTVPDGAALYVPVHAVHHNVALWDSPEAFDPDRFAPEQVRKRDRYAYLPFGAGPRTCIGSAFAMMEAAAILAVLLPTVHLRLVSVRPPVPTLKITLRPDREMSVRVDRR